MLPTPYLPNYYFLNSKDFTYDTYDRRLKRNAVAALGVIAIAVTAYDSQ
jgi:hypothetical protein